MKHLLPTFLMLLILPLASFAHASVEGLTKVKGIKQATLEKIPPVRDGAVVRNPPFRFSGVG